MPATSEALLVLIFFIAPCFIATRVKNRFVPFLAPSVFAETVESVILSCLHIPFWAWLVPLHGAAEISISPSDRELFLTAPSTPRIPGQNPRLALYDENGTLIEDLEASGAKGVWIRINDQVRSVEVFS